MPGPDDLAALHAERDAADRAYNDALTRLDQAIQQLPQDFPHPPPALDEHQITPLNTLWKIDPSAGARGPLARALRRVVAPLFERQQAFNAALVDHLNRNVTAGRAARESAAATLTVLHDTIGELVRFQSLLIVYLQQITPYVDTRDRDVAGVIRGLSGAINAVADEVLKRSESASAREHRQDGRLDTLDAELRALGARLDELARVLAERQPGRA